MQFSHEHNVSLTLTTCLTVHKFFNLVLSKEHHLDLYFYCVPAF